MFLRLTKAARFRPPGPVLPLRSFRTGGGSARFLCGHTLRKTENFFKKRVSLWKKDAGASFSGKTVHTYTEGDAGYTMTNIL